MVFLETEVRNVILVPLIMCVLLIRVAVVYGDVCSPCVCNPETHADCSSRGLTTFPSALPTGLVHLDVSNNDLGALASESLTRYPNLQFLNLSNIGITALPYDLFLDSSSLRVLDFSGNTLDELEYDGFFGLDQVETIHGLAVNEIHKDALSTQALRKLQLTVNSGSIPEDLFSIVPLTRLELKLPQVPSLPSDLLGELTETLEHLTLEMPMATQLYTLYFQHLVQLKTWSIVTNLDTIPRDLFFGDFEISGREDRKKLALHSLSVSGVRNVTSVHFQNLPRLATVSISGASKTVPGQFPNSVTSLGLTNCGLTEPNSNHVTSLLTQLDLSHNNIHSIPLGIFSNASSLTVLNLSFNNITDLNPEIFSPLSDTLTSLDLRNNSLCPLTTATFNSLHSIIGPDRVLLDNNCSMEDEILTSTMLGSSESTTDSVSSTAAVFVTTEMSTTETSETSIVTHDLSASATTSSMSGDDIICQPCDCDVEYTVADCSSRNMRAIPTFLPKGIRRLDMSDNMIYVLSNQSFERYSSLEFLNLSNIGISELPSGVFSVVPNLTVLDLSFNSLMHLQTQAFCPLSHQLLELDLRHNDFCPLPSSVIHDLNSTIGLDQVRLDTNCIPDKWANGSSNQTIDLDGCNSDDEKCKSDNRTRIPYWLIGGILILIIVPAIILICTKRRVILGWLVHRKHRQVRCVNESQQAECSEKVCLRSMTQVNSA